MRTASVTIKQTVILIGVVVILVFVVSFATTVIGPTREPNKQAPGPNVPDTQLAFGSPTTVPPPTADKPEATLMPWEWQTPGHRDFWFRNDRDDPVQVTIARVGCAACTRVELCMLPETMKQLKPDELDARAQDPALAWQVMDLTGNEAVTVPAHAAGGIRLNWQKKERASGPEAISTELETQCRKTTGHSITLRVNLGWVEPVMIAAEETLKEQPKEGDISVGTIEGGGAKTVNLLCWSFTRPAFTLKPKPPDDPCLTCGTPEPLSEDERKKVGESTALPSPVLCAYRVPVTVRERTEGGKPLDLGRFRRLVKFTTDATPEEGSATITGVVRGDITVGTGKERDVVVLGSFERSEGSTKDVTLTTERSDLELEVESKPEFMTVELREEKGFGLLGKTWTLSVTVPPNALDRPVPPHTYIVLKTKGDRPRRINIPVIGIAYVR